MKTTIDTNNNENYYELYTLQWAFISMVSFSLQEISPPEILRAWFIPQKYIGYNYPLFGCLRIPDNFSREHSLSQHHHYSPPTFFSFTNGSHSCFQIGCKFRAQDSKWVICYHRLIENAISSSLLLPKIWQRETFMMGSRKNCQSISSSRCFSFYLCLKTAYQRPA